MTELKKKRPEFRNINAFKDLTTYRLPPAGWVSILHRASGGLMFVLLPLLVWLLDQSLSSVYSHAALAQAFVDGVGVLPGWLFTLVILALVWAYLHHLIAGVRHLYMDARHAVSKSFGRSSAIVTLVLSLGLTAVLGAKLFGLY